MARNDRPRNQPENAVPNVNLSNAETPEKDAVIDAMPPVGYQPPAAQGEEKITNDAGERGDEEVAREAEEKAHPHEDVPPAERPEATPRLLGEVQPRPEETEPTLTEQNPLGRPYAHSHLDVAAHHDRDLVNLPPYQQALMVNERVETYEREAAALNMSRINLALGVGVPATTATNESQFGEAKIEEKDGQKTLSCPCERRTWALQPNMMGSTINCVCGLRFNVPTE